MMSLSSAYCASVRRISCARVVMPLADDARRGHLGAGLQRVDGRIKTFAGPLAREHDGRREMRERMHRRRVGEIVRRHIHRLDGGDGAGVGVGDALLQPRQLGAHRGLIAQTRRHLPHQPDTSMPAWMKRKILSISSSTSRCSSSRKYSAIVSAAWPHAEPAARRLVHLAEDHHHVRQHAGCLHLAVELLAFATPLADAAEKADALVMPDHVVDHFGEQHRLAHARPAEQPRLAAALQRHEHINDLDPVSKISDLVERRASGGGARCTERHWTSDNAAPRSMALPNTSNMRERIPLPTGAFSGPPVSSTAMPRASPCVGVRQSRAHAAHRAAPALR
jgi:hypothetical protein